MPKKLPKDHKSKKAKRQRPSIQEWNSPDDFLQAGVELEEAGEKWRAGDAAKANRFFDQAVDVYSRGLVKYPLAFDLAYNRARVHFSISQYPKLVADRGVELTQVLETALECHRQALRLRPEYPDVLFNTAQNLLTLGQHVLETSPIKDRGVAHRALQWFQESLDLVQRCLVLQEQQLTSTEQMETDVGVEMPDEHPASESTHRSNEESMHSPLESTHPPSEERVEQWATIEEPVTPDTILDTLISLMEIIQGLAAVYSVNPQEILSTIDQAVSGTILPKLELYTSPSTPDDRRCEITTTKIKMDLEISEARYRCGLIPLETYQAVVDSLPPDDGSIEGLCERAEAYIAFTQAADVIPRSSESTSTVRWTYLTRALECLTLATTVPSLEHGCRINLARGDAEMLRYQLSQPPPPPLGQSPPLEIAVQAQTTVLQNAQTFYRGAGKFAQSTHSPDDYRTAQVMEAIATYLAGKGRRVLDDLWNGAEDDYGRQKLDAVVTSAQEEGLISPTWMNP